MIRELYFLVRYMVKMVDNDFICLFYCKVRGCRVMCFEYLLVLCYDEFNYCWSYWVEFN